MCIVRSSIKYQMGAHVLCTMIFYPLLSAENALLRVALEPACHSVERISLVQITTQVLMLWTRSIYT